MPRQFGAGECVVFPHNAVARTGYILPPRCTRVAHGQRQAPVSYRGITRVPRPGSVLIKDLRRWRPWLTMHCPYAAREERTLKLPELPDASSTTPDRHIAVVYGGYQRALRVPSARPDAPAAMLLHHRRMGSMARRRRTGTCTTDY